MFFPFHTSARKYRGDAKRSDQVFEGNLRRKDARQPERNEEYAELKMNLEGSGENEHLNHPAP